MDSGKEKALDVEKLLQNKLKSLSVADLETGIGKAVSELVGEDYKCTIGDVKYTMFSGAEFRVKIELSINSDD